VLRKRIDLQSGPFQVRYDDGRLRYVRVNGVEVLRQIYMAVRDRHWNTIPGQIVSEEVRDTPDGFVIAIEVEHRQGDIDFRWSGRFHGIGDLIEVNLDGQAHSSFLRNRIGWCVLHPIAECIGKPCEISHTDGSVSIDPFPTQVAPHQPFLDIQSMSWSPAPGLRASLEFDGDAFETEDQRNWTDDSFKTYSTPLRLPFPVQVNAGDRLQQRIVLTIEERPSIRLVEQTSRFPDIAVLGSGDLHPIVNRAPAFEATVHVRTPADLEACKDRQNVVRWIVYDVGKPATTPETLALARSILPPGSVIGGGADTNFAELNRNRAIADIADFVAFSANPQAHATDELTIVENLPAIGDAIESARVLSNGKPVALSPLTLKRRFNPHAREAAEPEDPREGQPFGAAWLVGVIKYAAEAGAASITLKPSPIIDRIASFGPESVQFTETSHALRAVALALRRGTDRLVLIANLTEGEQEIEFEGQVIRLARYEVAEA
jgi:hypothetical protein